MKYAMKDQIFSSPKMDLLGIIWSSFRQRVMLLKQPSFTEKKKLNLSAAPPHI